MAFGDLLQHSATLQRLSTTKDSSGGTVNSYSTVASFNCLIRGASANLIIEFAQKNIQVSHTIVSQYAGGTAGDRVVDADGSYYEVKGRKLQRGVGTIDTFYELTCNQIL